MIFYFTGTGNSEWIAKQIARKINETTTNISSLTSTPNIEKEKVIGFVFPIYAWGTPEPMVNLVKCLPKTDAYTFGVCTCGLDAGLAMKKLSSIYALDSSYSVTMPNNYVVGSNVESPAIIKDKLVKARDYIDMISDDIKNKKRTYHVHQGTASFLKSSFGTYGFNRFARTAKPFWVNEKCIGCGLCVKECPSHIITMKDSKPVWGDQCYQCLHCINCCPKEAIQYGKKSSKRGRYQLSNWIDINTSQFR